MSCAIWFKGSLLDYVFKKVKLLLEMRSFDTCTMIDLIAAGLPEFILNIMNREILEDIVGLFNEVGKCEHMIIKTRIIQRNNMETLYQITRVKII